MKKYVLVLLMSFVGVFFLNTSTYGQSRGSNFIKPLDPDVLRESSIGVMRNQKRMLFRIDTSLVEALELQDKFEKRLLTGTIISGIGLVGITYTLNLPTPIFQDNNPTLNEDALEKRKDRRLAGGISAIVTAIGGYLIIDSFKFNQRMEANLGLNQLNLKFYLSGKRQYFKGEKKFKGSQYFRNYHK